MCVLRRLLMSISVQHEQLLTVSVSNSGEIEAA